MIIFQKWERNKYLYSDRFDSNGPFWQARCHWCDELSDCYDTPEESSAWESNHSCSVVVPVESK